MPDRFLQDVITNLAFHHAWIEIATYYLRQRPDSKESPFVRQLLSEEQAVVRELSRTLRQHDYAPTQVAPDQRLIEQAKSRRTPETILRYIHHGILMSVAWYEDRLQVPEHPFTPLWRQLLARQRALQEACERTLAP